MLDIENADDVMMVNSGGLCEQFVGQHPLYLVPERKPRSGTVLSFWF
ncbi:hypothetical protein [Desulfobacula sp.]|nr:hypothetical protein [Desulfobacula sp.]